MHQRLLFDMVQQQSFEHLKKNYVAQDVLITPMFTRMHMNGP